MSNTNLFTIEEGSVALVTGASGSIGSAVAKTLHSQGAHVIISGTNEEKLTQLAHTLNNQRCDIQLCNLRDLHKCKEMVSNVKEKFKKIDILVCNAGIVKDGFAFAMSDANFSDVLQVNLNSVFTLNREVVKIMMRQQKGRIINIASVVGFTGNIGQANYCAAKSGMVGMTKCIAKEVAQKNITVNCIAPGFIESNMTEKLPSDIKSKILEHIPAQRFGNCEEVAKAVFFLASQQTSYITGSSLHINGGMFMA